MSCTSIQDLPQNFDDTERSSYAVAHTVSCRLIMVESGIDPSPVNAGFVVEKITLG